MTNRGTWRTRGQPQKAGFNLKSLSRETLIDEFNGLSIIVNCADKANWKKYKKTINDIIRNEGGSCLPIDMISIGHGKSGTEQFEVEGIYNGCVECYNALVEAFGAENVYIEFYDLDAERCAGEPINIDALTEYVKTRRRAFSTELRKKQREYSYAEFLGEYASLYRYISEDRKELVNKFGIDPVSAASTIFPLVWASPDRDSIV